MPGKIINILAPTASKVRPEEINLLTPVRIDQLLDRDGFVSRKRQPSPQQKLCPQLRTSFQ